MNTNNRPIYFPRSLQLHGTAASVGRFLWHFLQMAVAMELGMMVYHKLLWPLLAPTRFATLTDQYPLIGYWMMLISMALGMIVLMRYHKSTWRYCMEMTGAMFIPLVALTALVLLELCPAHILYGFGDPLMFLAMAAFMIIRPAKHAHQAEDQSCH
jgi:hypothetical protein